MTALAVLAVLATLCAVAALAWALHWRGKYRALLAKPATTAHARGARTRADREVARMREARLAMQAAIEAGREVVR